MLLYYKVNYSSCVRIGLVVAALAGGPAFSQDAVRLRNGRVLSGELAVDEKDDEGFSVTSWDNGAVLRVLWSQVSEAENAAAVRDTNKPNVLLRPVFQDLLDLASTSSTVLRNLLESLGDLVRAVDLIAGFMTVMANELDEISKKGIDDDMSRRHWKIMASKGEMTESRPSQKVVEKIAAWLAGTEPWRTGRCEMGHANFLLDCC